MKELNTIFNEFHAIESSYCGDSTDWKEAYRKLNELQKRCESLRIKNGKNFHYYSFIKRSLCNSILNESLRVQKKLPFI